MLNGKYYIGQSFSPKKRWSEHKSSARSTKITKRAKQIIDNAMQIHGIDNFIFQIIASCEVPCTCKPQLPGQHQSLEPCKIAINELEKILVIQYNCLARNGAGYNAIPGGSSGPPCQQPTRKGIRFSPATEFKKGEIQGRSFLKGNIPWNRGTKGQGICKATAGSFASKVNWMTDQELINMVNANGVTGTAIILGITPSGIYKRMSRRKLEHKLSGTNSGTFTSGSTHKMAKLTEEKVIEIVQLYNTGKYICQELAELFGVSRLAISAIMRGQNWSHITNIKPEDPKPNTKRRSSGSKHGMSILNEENVLEIIKLYNTGKYSYNDLGNQFSVSHSTISMLMGGHSWSSLTGIIPKTKKKSP